MHDYTILFQKDKLQLWPTDDMSTDDKLNAISRFVILLSLLGFVLTQSIRVNGEFDTFLSSINSRWVV